ncbi:PREDICTED: uncharacterized protein LOC105365130 [Ceratosolen solmsi marchali]|uniref:Uncharacterized protein LOC105365130 n=1 Tax=Ceratosolen solmsi marchali TaxID=326594 RepID=A0AAJ7DYY0_9HYME|nr:PREDICTED: uncharacterized protein LOC105365130 [Ceratosolen solmsi marchali]
MCRMNTKNQSLKTIDCRALEILKINKWDWEPDSRVSYPLMPRTSRRFGSIDSNPLLILKNSTETGWRLNDILLAAKVLMNSREEQHYTDEAEMRRVFGLVYDVLRFRKILDRALDNVGFWQRYGLLRKRERLVWLLLYDMHGRKFSRIHSNSAIAARNHSLKEADLLDVEEALLDMKTKVAAGVSRLRIGSSALSLDELLPAHLRIAEGVTWGEEGSIASGWVNSSKIGSRKKFIQEMQKLGFSLCLDCSPTSELEEHQYVFDPLCPKVVNIHERARERLAVSQLVRNHSFIFLERSLCLGAAALAQAFRVGRLSGPIILTHSLAPRHTGYLAELLADMENAGRLLAFSVGDNCANHQAYLKDIGISMQRCKLFSERYMSVPPLPEIDRATVVLATPPCSYTGVQDVVDLAIARGGDLQLLESLTSHQAESAEQSRNLLAEQMSTLKYALTRPNIQLVIYEVHTLLPCETTDMSRQVVQQVNRMAIDKFQRDHQKQGKSPAKDSSGKKLKSEDRRKSIESVIRLKDHSKSNTESEEISAAEVPIPESDLFEMANLNEVYERDCSKLLNQGSYIVVIKRKKIIQFNSQFMIKVAENKGIFGELSGQSEPQDNLMQSDQMEPSNINRKRRKSSKIQFDRITAPTHATTARALRDKHLCPRHQQHLVNEVSSLEKQVREARRRDAHRWWDEVAHAWRSNSNNADDYRFQALRTDPLTSKILSHVMHITYAELDRSSFAVP